MTTNSSLIVLTAKEWAQFCEMLDDPPPINERFNRALNEHTRVVQRPSPQHKI